MGGEHGEHEARYIYSFCLPPFVFTWNIVMDGFMLLNC